jgi:hypothetical protein
MIAKVIRFSDTDYSRYRQPVPARKLMGSFCLTRLLILRAQFIVRAFTGFPPWFIKVDQGRVVTDQHRRPRVGAAAHDAGETWGGCVHQAHISKSLSNLTWHLSLIT